jgi:hypothetical protein
MPKTTRVHSTRSRTRPYAGRPQQSRRRGSRGRHRGLDPADIENLHFHFADPDACLLGTARPNGPIVPTPLFEALRASALKIRPTLSRWTASRPPLVGIRTTACVHAQSFVGMFRTLAREADCAVAGLPEPIGPDRKQRAWTEWKYAMWDSGCKLPSQLASGQSRCFCGAVINIKGMSQHVHVAHMEAA